MEPRGPSKKRYSDKEVAKILRRASEIQQAEGATPSADGIGGSELVEIGSELGLDRNAIRQAIAEIGDSELDAGRGKGGRVWVEESILLEAPLDSERWEALTAELRSAFSRAGKTGKVGDVYEWSGGDNELDTIHVSALPVEGGTKLRITSSMESLLYLNVILSSIFSLMMAAVVLAKSPLPIAGKLLTLALFLTCIFGVVRWLFMGACRRRQGAIRRVLGKAQGIFESVAESPVSGALKEPTSEDVEQRLQG